MEGLRLFAVFSLMLFLDDVAGIKLVCGDFIKRYCDPEFQCGTEVESAAQKLACLGLLDGRIQSVEWAVVTTVVPFRRIRTELAVAKFLTPQRPMDQIPQRGKLGPLPR